MHTKKTILIFLIIVMITSLTVAVKPIYFLYIFSAISVFTFAIMLWNYIQALKFAFSKPPVYMVFTFLTFPISWMFSGLLFPIILRAKVASIFFYNSSKISTNILTSFKWGDLLNLQNIINDYQSLIYNYSSFLPITLQTIACFLPILIYLVIQYLYIAKKFKSYEFSETSCVNIASSILLVTELLITLIMF